MPEFPSFSRLNNILLEGYNTLCLFIHPLMDTYCFFHISTIVSSAVMNIGAKISIQDTVFGGSIIWGKDISRSRTAWSYGNSIFNFLRNQHTTFHSGCTFYTPTNGAHGFHFLHILIKYLLFSVFFKIVAILINMRWYLTVVLICIPQMISDVEHLMCSLVICILSLAKCVFKFFPHFLSQVVCFPLCFRSSLCILDINSLSYIICKHFLLFGEFSFFSVDSVS